MEKCSVRMEIRVVKKIVLLLIILIQPILSYSAGSKVMDFLNIGVGARPVGMGGAFVALADDVNAVYWNPAGLGQLRQHEVTFMHDRWLQEIYYNYLAYALPVKIGTLGFSFYHLTYGEIQGYDYEGAVTKKLEPYDLIGALSFGTTILEKENSILFLGANLKYIQEDLDEVKTDFVAADLGCILKDPFSLPLNLGVVAQNLGPRTKFIQKRESLPLNYKFGSVVKLIDGVLNIGFDLTVSRDDQTYINTGGEYKLLNFISLRAGFRTKQVLDNGLRYGLGIKGKNLFLDYSYVPYGELGDTHRFSLSLRFGRKYGYTYIENKIEKRFDSAKQYFYTGQLLKGYREFNEILALVPFHEGARDYIARTRVKVEEGMISKEIDKHLLSGREYFKKGEVIKARSEFDIVIDFDPENIVAKNYLQQIDKRFKEVVNSLFSQGIKYYNKGDYNIALNEMKKVLSFDPEHVKAKKYLLSVRKKLEEIEKIKKVQRANEHFKKGEHFYMDRKFVSALEQFKKALSLDKSDRIKNMITKTQIEIERLKKEKQARIAETKRKRAIKAAQNCYEQGVNFYNADKLHEAIKKFEEALKYNPLHKEAMEYQDKTAIAIKKEREAIEKENKVKAKEFNRRGLIEYNNGNIREAIKAWETALQLDPSHEEARANLERAKKEIKE